MNDRAHIALYRRFSSCYPRTFRDEYGDDLATTFALQLTEHGATRCWLRTARDLMITIPTQHLEPRMKRPPSSAITATCLSLAVGATLAAVATGTSFYGLILLLFAVVAIALAVMSRRAAKPALTLEGSASWKKFLATGSILLLIMIVLLNLPATKDQELSEVAWSVMAVSMLFSLTLIGAGVVLGAGRLANNRHHR
jgi:hypothetical protein